MFSVLFRIYVRTEVFISSIYFEHGLLYVYIASDFTRQINSCQVHQLIRRRRPVYLHVFEISRSYLLKEIRNKT